MRKYIISLILLSVFSCESKFPDRTGFYQIDYDSNSYWTLFSENYTFLINGHITNYSYDDRFILIEQNPIDSICECNPECFKTMESYDKQSYARCKEAFENSKLRKYWIVQKIVDTLNVYSHKDHFEKMENLLFGPYSKEDFLKMKTELGVDNNLGLI